MSIILHKSALKSSISSQQTVTERSIQSLLLPLCLYTFYLYSKMNQPVPLVLVILLHNCSDHCHHWNSNMLICSCSVSDLFSKLIPKLTMPTLRVHCEPLTSECFMEFLLLLLTFSCKALRYRIKHDYELIIS